VWVTSEFCTRHFPDNGIVFGCFYLEFMKNILDDILFLIGAGLVVYGVSLVFVPAAWMVAGVFAMLAGVLVGIGFGKGEGNA